jgi:hypothetical protein
MPLISEAHGDSALGESPERLDQMVVQLFLPLTRKEGDDLGASRDEFRAVPSTAILGIGERYAARVSAIPAIFCQSNFRDRGLQGERGN